MNKKSRFSKGGYYRPTPRKWRKLGDALLAVSSGVTAYAITQDMQTVSLIALAVGSIGKFLTNFFSKE